MEVSQFLKDIRLYDEFVNKLYAHLRDSARVKNRALYNGAQAIVFVCSKIKLRLKVNFVILCSEKPP